MSAAILMLAALALGGVAETRAVKGGTIRFNGAQPPKSFNAYIDNSAYTAMTFDLMYSRLLGMDENTGELIPEVAKAWRVSEDGCIFNFEIDERARWSDGASVTAEDVKWTFDAVMSPKSETGPWKSMLSMFKSPEVVAERKVRFMKAGESTKDWRDLLNCASFWILPAHIFRGKDFNKLDFLKAVSGGAYEISSYEPQVDTVLSRHGRWWRQDDDDCRGHFNFDRVVFRYFADNENAFEAFKARKIDVYPVYTARLYANETGGEAFRRNWILKRRVVNNAPIGFQGFAMNMRRKPFDDVRVRKAMALLLDRETMNSTMMNGAYFLLSSYYPDIYDEKHPCRNERIGFEVEKARELLKAAGYERGFKFTFLSRGSTEDKFLALYDRALKAVNIEMTIDRKDFASWMRDMDSFSYDMTWAAWGAGTVKYPELQWSSAEADRKGSNNITGFKSEAVDKLIAEEKLMESAEARQEAYRKMDEIIAAEYPYVLLWQTDSVKLLYWNKFGMRPGVLGRFAREESVLQDWWYDADRAGELDEAMEKNGFLPFVPEMVNVK